MIGRKDLNILRKWRYH